MDGFFLRSRQGRLAPGSLGRELVTFAAIGAVSTAAYAVLYLALRSVTGPVAANAVALLVTSIANTAANRRLTFGVTGREAMLRDQIGGLVALGIALAVTTAAANLLAVLVPDAGRLVELSVLVMASALATISRFALLRLWIAGSRPAAAASDPDTERTF
jgi:putative flippase GtrA